MNVTDLMRLLEQTDGYGDFSFTIDVKGEAPSGRTLSKDVLIELLILTFICTFGTIGNSLVVAVYSQRKHREISASLYMLNLAIADLITLIAVVGIQLSEYFHQTWPVLWRYDTQCALHRFGRFLTSAVTVYIMIAISVDRYIAVVRPISYKTRCTPKRTKYILVLIWLLCSLLSIPAAMKFKTKFAGMDLTVDSSGDACFLDQSAPVWFRYSLRLYISFAFTLIPATITGLVYTVLVVHVWKHNKEFSATVRSSNYSSKRNQWKIAKVLLAVYFGFMFCYTPYIIFQFSISFGYYVPATFANVGVLLPYANSCVNPVIYLLWSESFRSKLRFLCSPNRDVKRRKEKKSVSAIA